MERRRQLELFPARRRKPKPTAPYQRGSATSEAAAESVRDELPTRQRLALAILRGRGAAGLTREELATATGWPLQSVCPLVAKLLTKGLAVATAETRKTATGRAAEVFVATAK